MTFYLNDKVRIKGDNATGQIVEHEKADSGAMFYFVDLGPTDNVVKLHETELERA